MPGPRKVKLSPEYLVCSSEASAVRESRDCAVKAVSLATGAPYLDVLAFMAEKGRKARSGTKWTILTAAITHFGFRSRRVPIDYFLAKLPAGSKVKHLTTHHPDRFPAMFADGKTYLMETRRHVACVRDGVNHDWTRGKSARVLYVIEIFPMEE